MSQEKEQILLPNGQLYSLVFQKIGMQTLCIRFSFANPPIFLKHKPKEYNLFKVRIVDLDNSIEGFVKKKNDYALLDYLKVGLFLFLFLITYTNYRPICTICFPKFSFETNFGTIKKNIVMKKLLEKVYDYFSDALFGGKSATNF